jgi:hypothetical protein
MKLLHRLHSVPGASWPRWVWSCLDGLPIDYAAQTSSLSGSHWAALVRLRPVYRCLSKVVVGDGARASFWSDRWIGDVPLDVSVPELFTHSSMQCATVRQVLSAGLDAILVPRLSPVAARQRDLLLPMLTAVRLTGEADTRSLPLCDREDGQIKNSSLYKLYADGGERSSHFQFIWRSAVPSRVRFFSWLLVRGRIQCRSNLLRKKIIE